MAARSDPAAGAKLDGIQLLRALAALMVVAGHLIGTVEQQRSLFGAVSHPRYAGGAGVDVFFLISGFIMVFASRRMFGSVAGARDFVLRRLVRIVPLYWAATCVALALLAIGHRAPSLAAIAASFAFVPYDTFARGDGFAFPIVDLGWTLNYEMMFYVVFACCIPFGRRRGVVAAVGAIGAIVIAGMVFPPDAVALRFWTRPIVLEFAAGMLIALAHGTGRLRLAPAMRWAVVAIAVALYLADIGGLMGRPTTPNDLSRVLGWGLPSALLLIAAVAGPTPVGSPAARLGTLLGDSSYALYLLHPFVIAAALKAARLGGTQAQGLGVVFVVVTLVAACVGAVIAHKAIERPVTTWLTRRLQRSGAPIGGVPLPRDTTLDVGR